tara:strand:+ start:14735 stop:15430 length:696 start_codon:yes stop_codon:yes gene_type:complete
MVRKKQFIVLISIFVVVFMVIFSNHKTGNSLPENFVYITDVVPNVLLDIRYYGTDNFVGRRVEGYEKPVAIVTKECAQHLQRVALEVAKLNYQLKIMDAYRPQRAVNHFSKWAMDLADTLTKSKYYPEVDKSDLFKLNYIASKSGHSRGSTVDLTLVDKNGMELDMGSTWDYFGTTSWPSDTSISKLAQKNRNYLRSVMLENGFQPYHEEWWHFTLKEEPFPETYFNFLVE